MKTSYRKVGIFSAAALYYLADHKQQTSKFILALRRVQSRLQPIKQRMEEKQTDLSIEHASVDEESLILMDDKGNYRFTKDALRKRNEAEKKLLDKEDVIIEACVCPLIPEHLTDSQLEAFSGFVIDPEKAKEIRAKRLTEILTLEEEKEGDSESSTEAPGGEKTDLDSKGNGLAEDNENLGQAGQQA